MPRAARPTADDLDEMARLRARASSWSQVAGKFKRAERTLRDWLRKAGRRWPAALARAEREYLREMAAEGLYKLRQQIHGKEPAEVRAAAVRVLAVKLAADRMHASRRKKARPLDPAALTVEELEDLLLGVSDDVAAAAFAHLRPRTPPDGAGGD